MSQSSEQRILQTDLKMFPYKIFVVHKLSNKGKQLQFTACRGRKNETPFNMWF
jgi:hypothetical protein